MDSSSPVSSLDTLSLPYRQHLVAQLREAGILTSVRVFDAFLMIPRHRFLREGFLERGNDGWNYHIPAYMTEEDWLTEVYMDKACVTQVKNGISTSSSSQPSIMAAMLEALAVRAGQRVLEIGTGTGYNAGLLAHIAGNPHLITTVELDPTLALKAQQALDEVVGPGVAVIIGDGREDFPHTRYDRIIATASCPCVPKDWLEHLSPGGRLICVLQPDPQMRGALLQIDHVDGACRGRLLRRAGFMGLRGADVSPLPQPKVASLLEQAADETIQLPPVWALIPSFLKENDFPFFLQYELAEQFPGIRILPWAASERSFCTLVFHPGSSTLISVISDEVNKRFVELRGSSAHVLWSKIQQAYGKWREIGRPGIIQYHWTYEASEQRLYAGELTNVPNWRLD